MNRWWNARTWPIFDDDNYILGIAEWAEPRMRPTRTAALPGTKSIDMTALPNDLKIYNLSFDAASPEQQGVLHRGSRGRVVEYAPNLRRSECERKPLADFSKGIRAIARIVDTR